MTELSVAARRYRDLVEQLGDELGRRWGWKQRVASLLGVHPSFVTKTLGGQYADISTDTVQKAAAAVGIDPAFFADASSESVPFRRYALHPVGPRIRPKTRHGASASPAVMALEDAGRVLELMLAATPADPLYAEIAEAAVASDLVANLLASRDGSTEEARRRAAVRAVAGLRTLAGHGEALSRAWQRGSVEYLRGTIDGAIAPINEAFARLREEESNGES